MSTSGLNAGKRSSPPVAVAAAPVISGALRALLLGALAAATVAGLLLRGPKYPLAFGLGIVAIIKLTSGGVE
jgi:hypothetical protein